MDFIHVKNEELFNQDVSSGLYSDSIAVFENEDKIKARQQYYYTLPDNQYNNQVLRYINSGDYKWDSLLAEDLLAYGVQWNKNQKGDTLTRIGNLSLHRTLPIQSQMRGCIAQDNKVMYWLDPSDWKWREDPEIVQGTISITDVVYQLNHAVFVDNRFSQQWIKVNNVPVQVTGISNGTGVLATNSELLSLGLQDGDTVTIELGAVLNGYDGVVRVYTPEFYIKSYQEENINKVYISQYKIDDSWEYQEALLIDAYKVNQLRSVPENMGYLSTLTVNSMISVVNSSSYIRGGNSLNQTTTNVFQSSNNKDRTGLTYFDWVHYIKNTNSSILSYKEYKNIFYWLYVIEYASFNIQLDYNSELTDSGFHQGGLGKGVTEISETAWKNFNKVSPLIPHGFCNSLGNSTGVIPVTIEIDYASYDLQIPRWRGFDNIFGHNQTLLSGIMYTVSSENESTFYISSKPNLYPTTLQEVQENCDRTIIWSHDGYYNTSQNRYESYVTELYLGNNADMISTVLAPNLSTNYRRGFAVYPVLDSGIIRIIQINGFGYHGARASIGFVNTVDLTYQVEGMGVRTVSNNVIL